MFDSHTHRQTLVRISEPPLIRPPKNTKPHTAPTPKMSDSPFGKRKPAKLPCELLLCDIPLRGDTEPARCTTYSESVMLNHAGTPADSHALTTCAAVSAKSQSQSRRTPSRCHGGRNCSCACARTARVGNRAADAREEKIFRNSTEALKTSFKSKVGNFTTQAPLYAGAQVELLRKRFLIRLFGTVCE
jgi:hypothetical protein